MAYGHDLDGCGRCIKYTLHFVNLLIFLGGLVLLAIGIWSITSKTFVNELLGTNLYIGAVYIVLITGAIITFISCLGCYGSAHEIRCMLLLYFLILFLIFVTILVGGILSFVFREKAQQTIEMQMQSSLRYYGNKEAFTGAWDATQEKLHCCGVTSYLDWRGHIPESCCREPTPNKKAPCQSAPSQWTLYDQGCLNVTTEYVKNHATIVGGVAIGLACLLIFGMIFSCALVVMIE